MADLPRSPLDIDELMREWFLALEYGTRCFIRLDVQARQPCECDQAGLALPRTTELEAFATRAQHNDISRRMRESAQALSPNAPQAITETGIPNKL